MGFIFFAKAYYTAKATIFAYPQSDHALPHWKCVLQRCAKCPCVNIPDQEKYDQYSNTIPSILFHIYHIILRCTTHGRLPLNDKRFCRVCKHNSASEQPTKIYTRKEIVTMEIKIIIFIQVSIFQKSRSWHFTFHMYKEWVQITVVTLSKPRLNSANHFHICYAAMIMLMG